MRSGMKYAGVGYGQFKKRFHGTFVVETLRPIQARFEGAFQSRGHRRGVGTGEEEGRAHSPGDPEAVPEKAGPSAPL